MTFTKLQPTIVHFLFCGGFLGAVPPGAGFSFFFCFVLPVMPGGLLDALLACSRSVSVGSTGSMGVLLACSPSVSVASTGSMHALIPCSHYGCCLFYCDHRGSPLPLIHPTYSPRLSFVCQHI